jgi:argininosuccinate lyase
MPFREAHEVTGRLVAFCIKKGKGLEDLSIKEFKTFSEKFEKSVQKVVKVQASVSSRVSEGGTALRNVRARLALLKKRFHIK